MTRATSGDGRPAAVAALVAEILGRGSAVRLKVTGPSMGPLVPSGARVLLRPVDPQTLTSGDIVMFRNALGTPVLHRIVRVDRDPVGALVFRTKGDGQIAFDDPVLPGRVMGRAVRVERALPAGRCWVMDLDTRRWRWAGRAMACFQLRLSKILLKLASAWKTG